MVVPFAAPLDLDAVDALVEADALLLALPDAAAADPEAALVTAEAAALAEVAAAAAEVETLRTVMLLSMIVD